jgi:S1-C subfamily serine protease
MTPNPPERDAMSPHLPDAVARVARSVLAVSVARRGAAHWFGGRGIATGCAWRDGVVTAQAHAVWRASRVRVLLPDGESAEADVKGVDGGTDLAALALDGSPALTIIERSAERERRAGEFVFAVARDASGLASASFGHIGATAGAWRSWRGARIDQLIRLDGGLYPGFSGAPVADAAGHAIGIATAALSRLHGIVLPAATVDRVVTQLLAHGRVAHGYLGLALQPVQLPDAQAAALDIAPGGGLLVTSVADDGPAADAGVLLGDVLVELGGARVQSIDALRDALGGDRIGARLPAVLVRGGQRLELTIQVGERARGRCG